jgi:hypothetical protein
VERCVGLRQSGALLDGRMTPRQLQKLLDVHGLSQRGTAKALGIDERTMRRYTLGELPIPQKVSVTLMLYDGLKLTLASADGVDAGRRAIREFDNLAVMPGGKNG